jgi:valyl-tRNA synthetase
MESRYSSQIETAWYEQWLSHGDFKPAGKGKPFSVVIPPPNVTGALHLGHALNNTIQDILVRFYRKQGRRTLWVPGTDHAGIATQAVVEKRLFELEGKTRHHLGREALVERIWAWKDEYEKRICGQLQKMGSSCDWSRKRFTLDDTCAKAVRQTFFSFFRKKLIYRGKRLVNWDTHLQTAVADDEIFHKNMQSSLWHIRYHLSNGEGFLEVATTRPETLLGDTAVAVHPEDKRYRHLIGKTVAVPFVNRKIPIIADALLVDMNFGTGCVKVTPAHDPNDYQTGLRHKLPMINLLNPDGTLNENAGPFAGLDRYAAREALVQKLDEAGLLILVEPHEMAVGHSDRSKTPVEPYLSDQWFVSMDSLAEKAMEAVNNGQIRFTPERYARTYLDWLGEKRDWCISRQLWWGHQIPIWYCKGATQEQLEHAFAQKSEVVHFYRDENALEPNCWLIGSTEDLPSTLPGTHIELIRDPDVLDTWFSSALWPHSTLGWPAETADLAEFYPTSVLVTSRDIISLWVARMVVTGLANTGKIPFDEVYIHPKILDGEGRTMSKSLGNGVDPLDIIEKYGTDALRFTMASLCTDNQDVRLPVKQETLEDGRTINTSDKFETGRNFANKLWNACRFIFPHLEPGKTYPLPKESDLRLEDRWIIGQVNDLAQNVSKAISQYRFAEMVQLLYHFTWDDFCSRFLEVRKAAFSEKAEQAEKEAALGVFLHVVEVLLHQLHPLMPFITEELWKILFPGKESLITLISPQVAPATQDLSKVFDNVFQAVEAVRSARGQYGISAGQSLKVWINLNSPELASEMQKGIEIFSRLSKITDVECGFGIVKPKLTAVQLIPGGEVYVDLAGVLDIPKEIAKLEAQLTKARQFAGGIEKKLANEGFTSRAPAEVIDAEKNKLQSQLDIIAKSEQALQELRSL